MAKRQCRANKRKLYITEKENNKLKAELKEANRKIEQRGDDIDSLHRHHSALERRFDFTKVALKKKLNKAKEEIGQKVEVIDSLHRRLSALEKLNDERVEAQEELKKKVDEEIISLKQSLHAQKKEIKRVRASAGQLKKAGKVKLEELHTREKEKLNAARSALKKSQLRCDALEENLLKQLADTKENHHKEITEQGESHQKELPEKQEQAKNELFVLCESDQQHKQEKTELEEMLLVKEKIWKDEEADKKEDIQNLMEENNHPQELIKNKRKKRFWRWGQFVCYLTSSGQTTSLHEPSRTPSP
ncbi:golgin subfamily A member 6-like protein 22 [Sebastes umbrosus]|uniref:golgin subfamily A member 6-like protein 22 n=1 Tax=Sebastes umbrosus TaxID=72105 RepID=UPI00189EFF71|nr:golgin subfamily A member 6-like protein 22 [Sebastes umbrosus]